GVAIDVPESDIVSGAVGVLLTLVPNFAEIVAVPGAETSGFMRPSAVGPEFEKPALVVLPAWPSAATVTEVFELPGAPVAIGADWSLPAAMTTSWFSCLRVAVSTLASSDVYCPDVPAPQLSLWMRAPPAYDCASVPSKSMMMTARGSSGPMSWNRSCAFGAMPSASSWFTAVGVEARYVVAPNVPAASPTIVPVVC